MNEPPIGVESSSTTPTGGGAGSGDAKLSAWTRYLLIGAAIVLVLAGMQAAASIIGPLLLSVFLAIIGAAALRWLERRGLSPRLAFLTLLCGLIAVSLILVAFLTLSFNQLLDAFPQYWQELKELDLLLRSSLANAGIDLSAFIPTNAEIQDGAVQAITALFSLFQEVAGELFIILLATGFLLFEIPVFRSKLDKERIRGNLLVMHLLESGEGIVTFLIIRIQINLIVGIGFGVFLYVLGVDFALLWGFLAFILGFIPYIGFLLTAIPPFLLALVEQGPIGGVIVIVGLLIINFLGENILFPEMAGRGLNLSPFVVIVSIFFWGFILGWLGVFLAVPLTLVVKVLLESSEETRWLAEMMSSEKASRGRSGRDAKK